MVRQGQYKFEKWALFAAFLLGIASRVAQYVSNRSLWFDEALLALKVIPASVPGHLVPLQNVSQSFMVSKQAASPVFLLITEILIGLFGYQEMVLRLLPFISGIGSIILFYFLIGEYTRNLLVKIVCLTIFSTSEILIYYSAEFKPYAVDAMIAVAIHLLFIRLYKYRLSKPELFFWSVFCAFIIWFSFPSIFILAGGVAGLLVAAVKEKKRSLILNPVIPLASFILLSFLFFYFLYLREYTGIASLHHFWKSSFMPLSPFENYGIPWYGLKWYYFTFLKIFKNPVGISIPVIGAVLSLIGFWSMFRSRYYYCLTLIIPILLTLGASSQGQYPFHGRMIIFLSPAFILFIGCGFESLINSVYTKNKIILALVTVLLIGPSVYQCVELIFNPVQREEIKPVMEYISGKSQADDKIYVYFAAEYAFRYYNLEYDFNENDIIVGRPLINYADSKRVKRTEFKEILEDIKEGRRVWVLFSHVYDDDENQYVNQLTKAGNLRDSFGAFGAKAYLFELD